MKIVIYTPDNHHGCFYEVLLPQFEPAPPPVQIHESGALVLQTKYGLRIFANNCWDSVEEIK